MAVYSRAGEPKAWTKQFGLGGMLSLSIAKFGEEAAWHLALEAARRLQHFCGIRAASDAEDFRYSPKDLASLPACEEFCVWACGLDTASPTWARVADLEMLVPTNLPAERNSCRLVAGLSRPPLPLQPLSPSSPHKGGVPYILEEVGPNSWTQNVDP